VHRIEFRQIVRDAEIAYAISAVVRRHRLTEEETEKFLVELRISRAANSPESRIVWSLAVHRKGELRTRDAELIGRIAPLGTASLRTGFVR
jgi:hypothetical protein